MVKNPETPREEMEETKRELEGLKEEVKSDTPKDDNEIVESREEAEIDEELKSGIEKILNKSFENSISDFEKELTGDFTVDGYMKTIAESHKDLGMYIAGELGLPSAVFFGEETEGGIKFNQLNFEQKLNFISLKKAVDEITKGGDDLSKVSSDLIIQNLIEQRENLIEESGEYLDNILSGKSLSVIKSIGLTDGELNKLYDFLRNNGAIIDEDDSSDDEVVLYGKHGPIFGEEEGGTSNGGRQSEFPVWLYPAIKYGGAFLLGLLVGSGAVKSCENKSTTYGDRTKFSHPEMLLNYVTFKSFAEAYIEHQERIYEIEEDDGFLNEGLKRLGNRAYGHKDIKMKIIGDVEIRWDNKGISSRLDSNGVMHINVNRPIVNARNIEGHIIDSNGAIIRLKRFDNTELKAIKLGEEKMLADFIHEPGFESTAKQSLEKGLLDMFIGTGRADVKRVEVHFNSGSETKIDTVSERSGPEWWKGTGAPHYR